MSVNDDTSPTNQEPRLLHRLLRGELDEADIHLAAEQAAAAAEAAAADHQPQQPDREDAVPDAGECREGWTKQLRDEDARLFAELASYCNTISSDDHTTTSAEPDVDSIIVSPFAVFTL